MRTVLPKTRFHPASVLRKPRTMADQSYLLREPPATSPYQRVGSWRGPARHCPRSVPSGVALLDAPNIRCALHDEIGRAPSGSEDLDLRKLRQWHKVLLMIRKCYFVTRGHPDKRRESLRDAVRRCTWKWIEPDHPRYDYNEDPVDDYIINRIVELTEQFPHHQQRTISLVSHDGGYADYLERFLEVGGYVAIVGLVGRLSRKLYRLSDHPRAQLFDLDCDLKAVSTAASPCWTRPLDPPISSP